MISDTLLTLLDQDTAADVINPMIDEVLNTAQKAPNASLMRKWRTLAACVSRMLERFGIELNISVVSVIRLFVFLAENWQNRLQSRLAAPAETDSLLQLAVTICHSLEQRVDDGVIELLPLFMMHVEKVLDVLDCFNGENIFEDRNPLDDLHTVEMLFPYPFGKIVPSSLTERYVIALCVAVLISGPSRALYICQRGQQDHSLSPTLAWRLARHLLVLPAVIDPTSIVQTVEGELDWTEALLRACCALIAISRPPLTFAHVRQTPLTIQSLTC